MILTATTGTNADLFPKILELYFKEGDSIADVTYGNGVFWKNVDTSKYKLSATDIKTGTDFRKLPYDNEIFQGVILDPPYIYNPSKTIKKSISGSYSINETKYDVLLLELYGELSKGLNSQNDKIKELLEKIDGQVTGWLITRAKKFLKPESEKYAIDLELPKMN